MPSALAGLSQAPDQLRTIVSGISWSHPTWDLFIALFVIGSVFVYGLSLGRDRSILIILALYIAEAIVRAAPWPKSLLDMTIGGSTLSVPGVSYLIMFIVTLFLLARTTIFTTSSRAAPWWQSLIFSVLQACLLISTVLYLLPPAAVHGLQPLTRQIFVDGPARFAWLMAPIFAFTLLKGRRRRTNDDYDY